MKNIFKFLIVTFLLLIPASVSALSFSCEKGKYAYTDKFKCTLTGTAGVEYKSLKATIDEHQYISCETSNYVEGLLSPEDKKSINTNGKPKGEGEVPLVELTCTVNIKASNDVETQIVLKNVQYEIEGSSLTSPEILRSEMLTVEKYVNTNTTTTTSDTKPRDTSNGNSIRALKEE